MTPATRPPFSHEPADDLGFVLNRVTRSVRLKFAEALAGTGLTPQQAAVLMAIGRSETGHLTPRAIAEAVDSDQATTSGLLERLARDGWLDAVPNPADGRSRLIRVTPQARKTLPSLLETARSVSKQVSAGLSSEERATLLDLLGRVSDAAKPTAKTGEADRL